MLNQLGAPLLGRRLPKPRRLALEQFDSWRAQGAAVVDLRPASTFAKAHIPDSYAVGVDGSHSAWVGWLLSADRPLLLVADDLDQEQESVRQLARIGYDRVVGVLDAGFRSCLEGGRPVFLFPCISSAELERRLRAGEQLVAVDVRRQESGPTGMCPEASTCPHTMSLSPPENCRWAQPSPFSAGMSIGRRYVQACSSRWVTINCW
jgi:hydroxyacylglutathione hydrolase